MSVVTEFIVALPETEGNPLEWWTGDLTMTGEPIGTASYTMAFPFRSAEVAAEVAGRCRLRGAWRVQPMATTRMAARR